MKATPTAVLTGREAGLGAKQWDGHILQAVALSTPSGICCGMTKLMKPSLALDTHREDIRRIVSANRGLNPRVFGSVVHRNDTENSDLDLLIDTADGMTLFDMAAIAHAIEQLMQIKVDVRTPEDFSVKLRNKILEEARPV